MQQKSLGFLLHSGAAPKTLRDLNRLHLAQHQGLALSAECQPEWIES
jgi:hypothetical protein